MRVKLASYTSLSSCLKEWIHAMVWFAGNPSWEVTPNRALFCSEAVKSEYLGGGGANTFKVHLASGIIRVYKVYYYVARPDIKKENRRWMNIALVRALYPGDVKVHADTNDLPDLFLPIHP